MAGSSSLHLVPSLKGKGGFENRFDVAAQVIAAGTQDSSVRVLAPLSGPGQGQIGVRVGRVLVYVANREALACFVDAWTQAAALAEEAFGPELPPPSYRPRNTNR